MKTKLRTWKRMNVVFIVIFMLISIVSQSNSAIYAAATTTVKASKIFLNYSKSTIMVGSSKTLKATIIPSNTTNKGILWTSSDKRILTVSDKGVMKGIKNGKAIVTAKIKNTNVKTTCRVTVQAKSTNTKDNNSTSSTTGASDTNDGAGTQQIDSTGKSAYLKKSAIASQEDSFIPIDKVGLYNKNIINEELMTKVSTSTSTLPNASNASIPYWTGFACENKISKNFKDGRWEANTDGSTYFYEQQIKFISDEGFNCARILYSLSFLSNPNNILEVNKAELEQLDELISWGIKYNVHIMLSFCGLPGKAETSNEEENVMKNDELFRNPELAATMGKYLTMLARRYADIPNRNLSYELLAEPAVPDGNLDTYTKVLTPIVKSMWEASPNRILIVNDVYKQVPEQMAALGCCLSLHNHIYTVDSSRLPDISYKPSWPMEYLPSYIRGCSNQTLTLQSETEFNEGTFSMYVNEGNIQVIADSNVLLSSSNDKKGWVDVKFPKGTKKISVKVADRDVNFSAVKIKSGDNKEVTLVIHDLYTGTFDSAMPTILIKDNGSTQNIDNPQKVLNAEFLKTEYLQKFIDCAKKNNVGFLETEVGTDTKDLNKEDYKAYQSEWLKALKDNHIPWMYNCLHAILAPEGSFGIESSFIAGYTETEEISGTPLVKNKGAVEILRAFK